MLMMQLEASAGDHIDKVVKEVLETSKRMQLGVRVKFNGLQVFAWPHMDEQTVKRYYEIERDRRYPFDVQT